MFHRTIETGMVSMGTGDESGAKAVSADGSVVVGYSERRYGWDSFRCTFDDDDDNGNMRYLGDLPGGDFESFAYDISADGSVVVGRGGGSSGIEAYRWTEATGMVSLDESWFSGSYARAVSADGLVIVGDYHDPTSGPEAFRWTEEGGMVGLGDLPGSYFYSEAFGVSSDGSVIVGWSQSSSGSEAFIWDETNGMRSIKDILVNDYGLDLTGWTLRNALGISDDGLTIVGVGYNPSGDYEGWVAVIPEPATVLLLGLGAVMLRRTRKPAIGNRRTKQ